MDQSFSDIMFDGGWASVALWVVLAFSVLAVAVAIERLIAQWSFVTRARALGDTVRRCLGRGAIEESRSACERSLSPVADIFLVGFERLGRSKPENVATAVHRERLRVNQSLKTRLWMLGTIGATAPFVGLFGTVVGIMGAMGKFRAEDEVKFTSISGPISHALIVTAVGIAVAVEAVILYNYFSQRGGRIATEMKLLTDEFLELLLEEPNEMSPKSEPKKKPDLEDSDKKKGGKDGDREAA